VEEDVVGVLLVEVGKDLFGEGVDVIGDSRGVVQEWVGLLGGEVVRGAVDTELGEGAGDFGLGWFGFVGFSGDFLEFFIGGRGGG
jgi:hypothetical protein